VPAAEVLFGELLRLIQLNEAIGLGVDALELGFARLDKALLLAHSIFSGAGMGGHFSGRNEEVPELFAEDSFEIVYGDLVAAPLAHVLGALGPDVHLLPAGAVCEAGEEMRSALRRRLRTGLLSVEDAGARVPELFGQDRLYRGVDPLAFGLQLPGLRAVGGLGVVGPMQPLGGAVFE